MSEQFWLPGFELSSVDSLFFAVMPDEAAATEIERRALDLRRECGLRGKPLGTPRFHVTLCGIGSYDGVPSNVVAKAVEAAGLVKASPFVVVFDRAVSFRRGLRKRPFVLLGSDVAGFLTLQSALSEGMKRTGLGRWVDSSYTPHVTMLYDFGSVMERPVDRISWIAREFVLMRSLYGKTRYVRLYRWPLGD